MKSAKTPWRRIGAIALVLLGCALLVNGRASFRAKQDVPVSDGIIIRSAMRFAPLERPPVLFRHDRHTDSLKAYDKDCTACHPTDGNGLSLKFKRKDDINRQAIMDVYHENCIGCHREMAENQQTAGPVTCGECHKKTLPTTDMDPMGYDRSLHYRHVLASNQKCEMCHHEYDKTAKKTVYVKGKEGTCRYCHQQEDTETGMEFQTAAHLSCIPCHLKIRDEKKTAGPIQCRGCHDAGEKQNIITMESVPRIQRNQPDAIFVKRYDPEKRMPASEYRMELVPFDHQQHEINEGTCRTCHHAGLESCNKCHSMEGSEKGNRIKLEQAMHQSGKKMSCMGCHENLAVKKQCAGCHGFMAGNGKRNESSCRRCHIGFIEESRDPDAGIPDKRLPQHLLARQKKDEKPFDPEKIPQTVIIKTLEDQYEPVEFPHSKIVNALWIGMQDSRLAGYFHNGAEQMCRGCHHNSPLSEKPPQCGSCHGKPFDADKPLVPGLMGAYHRQCMGCHEKMEMAKPAATDCTACHKEKN